MTAWMMFVPSPSASPGGTPSESSRSRRVVHLWTAPDHFAYPLPRVQYAHSADPLPYFRSDARSAPAGSVPRGGAAFFTADGLPPPGAAFAGVVLAGACGTVLAGAVLAAAGLARSAAVVRGPTSPSTFRPCAFWNAFTAARVFGPKIPSTFSGGLAPRVLRRDCRSETRLPVSPWPTGC